MWENDFGPHKIAHEQMPQGVFHSAATPQLPTPWNLHARLFLLQPVVSLHLCDEEAKNTCQDGSVD